MSAKQKSIKINPALIYNKLTELIPILFAAYVSASFTWHFTASKTPFILSFAGAIVYQIILFRVFDFARKPNRKVFFAIYIIAIFLLTPFLSDFYDLIMAPLADAEAYHITVFDWFFSSGSYMTYVPKRCFQLLMYISLPLGAAIYFYTKVYLRISVLFIVALFPPIIYAKDYETYPPLMCVILMLLFFMTIIYCKFLKNNSEKQEKSEDFNVPASSAMFLAIAIFVAIIIPKPDIDDKRQEFDDFTNNRFSSQTGRITDNFTKSSNGNNSGNTSNRLLAQVAADEIINLKTQCYYYYDDSEDLWSPLEQDSELMGLDRYYMVADHTENFETAIEGFNPVELISDIVSICNENPDFAEKYNLTDLIGKSSEIGDFNTSLGYLSLNQNFSPSYFLTPENAYNLKISKTSTDFTLTKSDSGVLYPIYEAKNGLLCYTPENIVTIDYVSPKFINDSRTQTILRALSYEEYGDFLLELWSELDSEIAGKAYIDYYFQNEIYEEESERVFSRDIRELSRDITDGLYSDYEKAKAIERYFTENGFDYDVKYTCPKGENITHFIFESEEGSCYHFATAMTLMCRSVGLNARYCEGFSYSKSASNNYLNYLLPDSKAYIIDESCSHAFCEVYISGYGWMRFEPTVADNGSIMMGSLEIVLTVLVAMLTAALLALIFTKFIFPLLEKIYLRNLAKNQKYEKLCRYIMNALKKTSDSTPCDSSLETALNAEKVSFFNVTYIAECFDKCVYGGQKLDSESCDRMIQTLYEFYRAHSANKKNLRRQKMTNFFKIKKRAKNKG